MADDSVIKELIYRVIINAKEVEEHAKKVRKSVEDIKKVSTKSGDETKNASKKISDAFIHLAKETKRPLTTLTKGIEDLTKASVTLGKVGANGVGSFGGAFSGVLRSFGIGGALAGAVIGLGTAGAQVGGSLEVKSRGYRITPAELKGLQASYGYQIPGLDNILAYVAKARSDIRFAPNFPGFVGGYSDTTSTAELTARFIERVRAEQKYVPPELRNQRIASLSGLNLDTETLNQIEALRGDAYSKFKDLSTGKNAEEANRAAKDLEAAQQKITESAAKFSLAFIRIAAQLTPALDFVTDTLNNFYNLFWGNGKGSKNFEVLRDFEREKINKLNRLFNEPPGQKQQNTIDYARIRHIQHGLESSFGKNVGSNPNIVGDYQISPITALEAYGVKDINERNIAGMREKLKNPIFNEKTRDAIYNMYLARYGGNHVWALAAYHGWGGKTPGIVGPNTKRYVLNFFEQYPALRAQYATEYENLKKGNSLGKNPTNAQKPLAYSPNTDLMAAQNTALASNNSTSTNHTSIGVVNVQTDAKTVPELANDIQKQIHRDNTVTSYTPQMGYS